MRLLLLLCAALAGNAHAALEDWTCHGIADYYGYVAVDRDNGMSLRNRVNATVKAVMTVMDSQAAYANVEADDARALIQIVYKVYDMPGSAMEIRRAALMKCMRGALYG